MVYNKRMKIWYKNKYRCIRRSLLGDGEIQTLSKFFSLPPGPPPPCISPCNKLPTIILWDGITPFHPRQFFYNQLWKIKHDSYPSVFLYWVHTLAALFKIMNPSVTRWSLADWQSNLSSENIDTIRRAISRDEIMAPDTATLSRYPPAPEFDFFIIVMAWSHLVSHKKDIRRIFGAWSFKYLPARLHLCLGTEQIFPNK